MRTSPGRTSLRTRLLLIIVVLVATGLTAGYTIVIGTFAHDQRDRLDRQIRSTALALTLRPAALAEATGPSATAAELAPVLDILDFSYLTFVDADGRRARQVLRPEPRDGTGPRLPPLDRAAVAARGGRPFDVPAVDGTERWRVIALPVTAQGTSGGSVVVAASLREPDADLARLRTTSLLAGGAVLAVLTLAGWLAVRAGTRPLRRIEATAAAIAAGDLSHRVPDLAAPGTEVGRVAAALNAMLGQIERAFAARSDSEARMRRFVADVSHELRTPLAGIKGFTQLHRMGGLSGPEETARTMARIEREAARLANLTEDLLLLARLDEHSAAGGVLPMDVGAMDLRTLAADAQHDVRALDPSRPIELTGPDGGPPGGAPVLGDEERLRQVVANLIGNAVAHTPPGGRIRIGVGTLGDQAVLEVEDEGPGLTPEQAGLVFDRFYRADHSRSRGEGGNGAGLGLAIARSLVEAHHGRIELRTAPGRGALFRLRLPVDPAERTP